MNKKQISALIIAIISIPTLSFAEEKNHDKHDKYYESSHENKNHHERERERERERRELEKHHKHDKYRPTETIKQTPVHVISQSTQPSININIPLK